MKIRLLIPGLLVSVPAFAWQPQTGDIIFQVSRSSQSKAIQLATPFRLQPHRYAGDTQQKALRF